MPSISMVDVCFGYVIYYFRFYITLGTFYKKKKENRWFKTYHDLYIYFPERKAKVALITQEKTIPTTQEKLRTE